MQVRARPKTTYRATERTFPCSTEVMSSNHILTEQRVSALRLELSVQRSLHELTYDSLAELSGVSRRTLISIETGQSRGSLETWMKICRALTLDFSKFVLMSEEVSQLTVPAFVPLQFSGPRVVPADFTVS